MVVPFSLYSSSENKLHGGLLRCLGVLGRCVAQLLDSGHLVLMIDGVRSRTRIALVVMRGSNAMPVLGVAES
ncbi:hypothetical protein LINPERHAP2_LOCUS10372 [Linum perenne]